MKKISSIIYKVFAYILVVSIGTILALAMIIGIAEGDLSHGLLYYL